MLSEKGVLVSTTTPTILPPRKGTFPFVRAGTTSPLVRQPSTIMRNQSAAISTAEETTHEEWNKAQLSGYTCIGSLITQLVSIFCDLVDLPKKMGERHSALALGGALVLVLATAVRGGMPMTEIKGSVVVTAACGGFRPAPDDRAMSCASRWEFDSPDLRQNTRPASCGAFLWRELQS